MPRKSSVVFLKRGSADKPSDAATAAAEMLDAIKESKRLRKKRTRPRESSAEGFNKLAVATWAKRSGK